MSIPQTKFPPECCQICGAPIEYEDGPRLRGLCKPCTADDEYDPAEDAALDAHYQNLDWEDSRGVGR